MHGAHVLRSHAENSGCKQCLTAQRFWCPRLEIKPATLSTAVQLATNRRMEVGTYEKYILHFFICSGSPHSDNRCLHAPQHIVRLVQHPGLWRALLQRMARFLLRVDHFKRLVVTPWELSDKQKTSVL